MIDLFSKYAWVVPLEDKHGATILIEFQSILNDAKAKSNKTWVYQGTEFYNISFKKWLKSNGVKTHSTQNEEKCVLAETFIRTWVN